ncbi:MAG TPA: molybdenum cofactor biosynthesis protein MoaE [Sphingomicrobium sp.]|nr:molybdenum cofactor biosynthesis protein MoaE [Sphingomicrobium sp.]
MSIVVRLEHQRFDPADELRELLASALGDGAVVSFVGVARGRAKDGSEVGRLVLDHHSRLTLQSLEEIAADGARRFAATHVRVVHRCGDVMPGEPIVFAGAACPHRRAAFEAADYLMDRLKTEAVFWKREDGPAGSRWIEPTDADHSDRARWG